MQKVDDAMKSQGVDYVAGVDYAMKSQGVDNAMKSKGVDCV